MRPSRVDVHARSRRLAPRSQRFPLIVGTDAYRRLVTGPSWILIVSGAVLTLDYLVRGGKNWLVWVSVGISGILALGLISPFPLFAWIAKVARSFVEAYGNRACDLDIG